MKNILITTLVMFAVASNVYAGATQKAAQGAANAVRGGQAASKAGQSAINAGKAASEAGQAAGSVAKGAAASKSVDSLFNPTVADQDDFKGKVCTLANPGACAGDLSPEADRVNKGATRAMNDVLNSSRAAQLTVKQARLEGFQAYARYLGQNGEERARLICSGCDLIPTEVCAAAGVTR